MSAPLRSKLLRLCLLIFCTGAAMGTSCLNPCDQLSSKICSCEPTAYEQNACTAQAKLQQNQRTLGNDDRNFCLERLKYCECRALAAGHLEACGLSRE